MNPREIVPTRCLHCGYSNGGKFSVCPCCKMPVVPATEPPK